MPRLHPTLHYFLLVLGLHLSCPSLISGKESAITDRCSEDQRQDHPHLCHMMDRVQEEPEILAQELSAFSRQVGFVMKPLMTMESSSTSTTKRGLLQNGNHTATADKIPVVLAHGMGDSCFHEGMHDLTQFAGQLLDGAYAVCIPTADTMHEDVINGYFKSMEDNTEIFAAKIRADPRLANGFYAIGLSQGNNVIRGYLSLYNDPPVKKFISINGVNAGTGLLPYCIHQEKNYVRSSLSFQNICDVLEEQASQKAYSVYVQKHSFQANYWRDPRPEKKEAYQTYSQLARWNNEGKTLNKTLNENWQKTDLFVWIKADHDSLIWPAEGEHWGAPDPDDPFHSILPMKETEWYQKDLFGLRTADEAGKNKFESFPGDHLAFDKDQFANWVNNYLKA